MCGTHFASEGYRDLHWIRCQCIRTLYPLVGTLCPVSMYWNLEYSISWLEPSTSLVEPSISWLGPFISVYLKLLFASWDPLASTSVNLLSKYIFRMFHQLLETLY